MKLMGFFVGDQAGSSLPLFVGLFCQPRHLREGARFFKHLTLLPDLLDCATRFPSALFVSVELNSKGLGCQAAPDFDWRLAYVLL